MRNSPTALRLLKSAMNAVEDGQSGLQQLGGDATMLFYNSEEGNEVFFCFEDLDTQAHVVEENKCNGICRC